MEQSQTQDLSDVGLACQASIICQMQHNVVEFFFVMYSYKAKNTFEE